MLIIQRLLDRALLLNVKKRGVEPLFLNDVSPVAKLSGYSARASVTSLRPEGTELQSSRIDFPGCFLRVEVFHPLPRTRWCIRMKYTLPPLVPRRSDCPGCFLSRLPIGTYEARFYTLCLFHFLSLCRSQTISWFLASTTDSETFTVTLDRWTRTLGLLLLYRPHKVYSTSDTL